VADVAFVLGLQADGPDPEEAARLKEERRKQWWNSISKGAKARATKRATLREAKEAQLEARKKRVTKAEGSVGLNEDAATRIALEYGGTLVGAGDQVDLAKPAAQEVVEASEAPTIGMAATVQPSAAQQAAIPRGREAKQVRILWADLRDAAYAQEWPEVVVHAELERMAITKSKVLISHGRKEVLRLNSRSIHVIGGQKGSGWYLDAKELEALRKGPSEEARGTGAGGAKDAAGKRSQSDEELVRRQHAAESLREQGIEVEAPRRGLWARVKALVGR
jgi:hypothetical protein